jgi:hypothetical protein
LPLGKATSSGPNDLAAGGNSVASRLLEAVGRRERGAPLPAALGCLRERAVAAGEVVQLLVREAASGEVLVQAAKPLPAKLIEVGLLRVGRRVAIVPADPAEPERADSQCGSRSILA